VEGLTALPAHRLAGLLRSREVSATEVVAAHLDRLAAENPRLNAVVRLAPDALGIPGAPHPPGGRALPGPAGAGSPGRARGRHQPSSSRRSSSMPK
jgi:amidase